MTRPRQAARPRLELGAENGGDAAIQSQMDGTATRLQENSRCFGSTGTGHRSACQKQGDDNQHQDRVQAIGEKYFVEILAQDFAVQKQTGSGESDQSRSREVRQRRNREFLRDEKIDSRNQEHEMLYPRDR